MIRRAFAVALCTALGAPAGVAATFGWCSLGDCVDESCCDELQEHPESSWSTAPCCEHVVVRLARADSQRPDDPAHGSVFAGALPHADVVPVLGAARGSRASDSTAPPGTSIRIRHVSLLL